MEWSVKDVNLHVCHWNVIVAVEQLNPAARRLVAEAAETGFLLVKARYL